MIAVRPITHVWLQNAETGGKQLFSVESEAGWRARGWNPCNPPEDPDIFKDPGVEQDSEAPHAPVEDVAAESDGEQGQDETSTRAKGRRKTGSVAEE